MLNRIKYILSYFLLVWFYFLIQKPIFMLCNASKSYSVTDYLSVMWHGASLDATTTGYLTIIPFVLTIASVWFRHLPFRKIMTPYYIVVMFLISLIFIGDLSLFAFWESKLDASIFIYIDSPKNAIASVSTGYIFGRTLLILGLTALMSGLLWLVTPHQLQRINMKGQQMVATLCALPIAALLFLIIRGGFRVSTANVGDAYFSTDQFLNLSAINPAFNLFSSTERQARYEDEFNFYDETRRAQLMTGLYPKSDKGTTYVLNTARPNILVIFMESFGATMIERLGGAKGVDPNLEQLADEGIFFSRIFANSFRTDRGLVSTLSGHISYPTTSIMKLPAKSRLLPGIARTLQQAGYQTDFLYGGDINFTNMRSYFTTTGYQHLTSDTDFSLQERTSSSWGAHDEYTFDRLYEMLESRPADRLWHTGFLTLSSHEPFEVPYNRLKDKRQNSFAYTDHCLGEFIDRLKQLPVWNNLLVICLPDHGSSPTFNVTSPTFYHIPMLWLGGAIKAPAVIHTLMNQSDMPATLLGQLGLPHQDFKYSRNIFSTSYTYPFAYSTFSDGFMFKDSTGVTIFDNAARKPVYNEPAPDGAREEKGMAILQTSYDQLGEN